MEERQLLRGIAGHGLPGADVPMPRDPLTPQEWTRLRIAIRHQRVTGLAVAAADAGAFAMTAEQREELETEHVEAMAHVLRLERSLLRVHDVLAPLGIPVVVLKGTAVAHLDYPQPELRPFGDNDILLPSDRFAEAVDHLRTAGYRRPAPEIGEGFDSRFGKGATLLGQDSYELDVHRTFAMGPFGLMVDLEELWDGADHFELGGRRLRALGTEQRFLHACYHAAIGNRYQRVMHYRDVAEMLLFGSFDTSRLRALAESWGGGAVLARAVTDTRNELGLSEDLPLLGWAGDRSTSRREQRLLEVYTADTPYATLAAAGVMALPRWRDRLQYVRLLAMPAAGYTRGHGRSRLGWVLSGVRRMVQERLRSVARRSGGVESRAEE